MLNKFIKSLEDKDLKPVSGMDATFLYGETPTSPMHVGSLIVIEGSLKFKEFRQHLMSRLHLVPKFRQRLVKAPYSIDYPYWADDPNFNIDLHLKHMALPGNASWKELRRMVASFHSEPLDQNRPLWSFAFVEGLDNLSQVEPGSVALISKMHHVAIDGMAGAAILAAIADMSPNTKPIPDPKPWNPGPLPGDMEIAANSAISFAKKPLKFPKLVYQTVSSTVKAGFLTRMQHLDLPTAPFTAPKTQLNGIISARRKWNTTILELERVKALKRTMGTTLNDVILTICAGALRKFFLAKNKLPKKPLVAMIPISTKKEIGKENQDGNHLSNMLIQLATNIEDPIERLETIYENTLRGKTYQGAIGAKALSNVAEAVPFGIASQAAKMYSRYNLAKLHNPVFNCVITNVPGPSMPLYFRGHQIKAVMGMAPVIDGMGLIITILSYNGKLTISPTSDSKSMPEDDIHEFSDYILESANELEAAIQKYEKTKGNRKTKSTPTVAKPLSDVFFEDLKKYLKANPETIREGLGRFQFMVKGPNPAEWQLKFDQKPFYIRRGKMKTPDTTLTAQDKHLVKVAQGELDFMTAFVQGRVTISGDKTKAMRLGKILLKIQKSKKK